MSEQNSPMTIKDYLNTSQAEFLEDNKDKLGSATLGVIEAQREGEAEYNPLRDDQVFNAGQSSKFFGDIPSSIDLDITEDYNIDSWNESLNVIKDKITNARSDGGLAYTDEDIANRYKGDAYTEDENEFVSPWKNINDNDYSQVRGEDFLASANNNSNMQFTINNTSELKAYLRLIMPMYKRNVEVEDLNRNFWVIGNVLTYLCDFLFENKSPYANVLNSLLSEISQLWDNVLYLWQALQDSEKEVVTDVQTIILPINGIEDEDYDNIKFDNFNNISINKEILKVVARHFAGDDQDTENDQDIQNLCDSVEKQILKVINSCPINSCIVPVFRVNNYKHNYYSGEYIIGVFVHDVNFDKPWDFIPFKNEISDEDYFILGMDLSEEQEEIDFKCLREEETQYKVMNSFNGSIYSEERGYYALVRSEIKFKAKYDRDRSSGPYVIPYSWPESQFYYFDIVSELCNSDKDPKKAFGVSYMTSDPSDPRIMILEVSQETEGNQETDDNQEIEENQGVEENQETEENNDEDFIKIVDIEKGFYQGELLSYMKPPAEYDIGIIPINMIPVNCSYEILQDVFYDENSHKPPDAYNYNDNYMYSDVTISNFKSDFNLDPEVDSSLYYFQNYGTDEDSNENSNENLNEDLNENLSEDLNENLNEDSNEDSNKNPNKINIDTINTYLYYKKEKLNVPNNKFVLYEAINQGGAHNHNLPDYGYSDDFLEEKEAAIIGNPAFALSILQKNDDDTNKPQLFFFRGLSYGCVPNKKSNLVDFRRSLEWEMQLFDNTYDKDNVNPIRTFSFKIDRTNKEMNLILNLGKDNEEEDIILGPDILIKKDNNEQLIDLNFDSTVCPHFYSNEDPYDKQIYYKRELEYMTIERYINFIGIKNKINELEINDNEKTISLEFIKLVKNFLLPPYSVGGGNVHAYDTDNYIGYDDDPGNPPKEYDITKYNYLIPRKIDCAALTNELSYTAILYPPEVLMHDDISFPINNYNKSYNSSAFSQGGVARFYEWNGGEINLSSISMFKKEEEEEEYVHKIVYTLERQEYKQVCNFSSGEYSPRHPQKTIILIKNTDTYVTKNNWILIQAQATILSRIPTSVDSDEYNYLLCNEKGYRYVEDDSGESWQGFHLLLPPPTLASGEGLKYITKEDDQGKDYYAAQIVKDEDGVIYDNKIRYLGEEGRPFNREVSGFHLAGYNINVFKIQDNGTICDYYNRHADRIWTDDNHETLKWKNSFVNIEGNDESQLQNWQTLFSDILSNYVPINSNDEIPEYFYKDCGYKGEVEEGLEYYKYFCEKWGIKQ